MVSSIFQAWSQVCHGPYLYRHLVFEDLEYKTLVHSLQKIISISPRIKSTTMNGCYSKFVQNTIVPVSIFQQSKQ
jgi:hypothetical protein